jgi:hypothetical protein
MDKSSKRVNKYEYKRNKTNLKYWFYLLNSANNFCFPINNWNIKSISSKFNIIYINKFIDINLFSFVTYYDWISKKGEN